MKVFISSLITGMEPHRAAAKAAIESLGLEAVMAEDFRSQPTSPQIACLQGLRSSDAVVLVLGDRYGTPQASGLSPTHAEFREARDSRPVFVFTLKGGTPEPSQQALIDEAGGWNTGLFREDVASPADLARGVTRGLHEWIVAKTTGVVDEQDLVQAATEALPSRQRGFYVGGRTLAVAVAGGPRQAILRPSNMDSPVLIDTIKQAMLFGPKRLFAEVRALDATVHSNTLVVRYDGGTAEMKVNGRGTVVLTLPVPVRENGLVMVEEDVRAVLRSALSFIDWLLGEIDPTQRLTHVAPMVTLVGDHVGTWMSEHELGSRGTQRGFSGGMDSNPAPLSLEPASRPRPALRHEADAIVDDFVALLRRQVRGR